MNLEKILPQDPKRVSARPPTYWLRAAGCVILVVCAVGGIALSVTIGTPTHTSSGSKDLPSGSSGFVTVAPSGSSPSPTAPAPEGAGPAPDSAGTRITNVVAKSSVKSFLSAVTKINADSGTLATELSTVASGTIVDELANEQQELKANGWTLSGIATVDSVKIVSTNTSVNPSTVTVQACVDSSDVQTLDSDGKSLGIQTGSAARALNLYTLQHNAAGWRIVSRTFPNDTTC